MSRIGNAPITVPSGVEVSVAGRRISVKGPKGSLERQIPGNIDVAVDGETLTVTRPNDENKSKALHGLTRSLVNNMVLGVTEGFRKELEIHGVGYRAEQQGPNKLPFLPISSPFSLLPSFLLPSLPFLIPSSSIDSSFVFFSLFRFSLVSH